MTLSDISRAVRRALGNELSSLSSVDEVLNLYEYLLTLVNDEISRTGKSVVLGICGPQGSGKSTMARVLAEVLRDCGGLSVATLSLDDLYLSRAARAQLARERHPLLSTRGVPGTHDVELGIRVLSHLTAAVPPAETRIPRFDKSADEPFGADGQDVFIGRADVVIFEGWCVGALPQETDMLATPANALERDMDADGRWRRYVNEQLAGRYQALFATIDVLVMLRAPRFERVVAWRQEQERHLAAKAGVEDGLPGNSRIMSDEDVTRFVQYFERLTRHMLTEMPARADVVIELDDDRRIAAISKRSAREERE
jgi:D-glycerate 3-kinase